MKTNGQDNSWGPFLLDLSTSILWGLLFSGDHELLLKTNCCTKTQICYSTVYTQEIILINNRKMFSCDIWKIYGWSFIDLYMIQFQHLLLTVPHSCMACYKAKDGTNFFTFQLWVFFKKKNIWQLNSLFSSYLRILYWESWVCKFSRRAHIVPPTQRYECLGAAIAVCLI